MGREIFFPSCKITRDYPGPSRRLAEYLTEKHGVETTGCCRINHQQMTEADRAILVCNNCAIIMKDLVAKEQMTFVWELIDRDEDFVFPDYQGEEMTIQDCRLGHGQPRLQEGVRAMLKKMNIRVVELPENREDNEFCGVNVFFPPDKGQEEKAAQARAHCGRIKTVRAACYCKFCKDALVLGGKDGIHLLELLFPEG